MSSINQENKEIETHQDFLKSMTIVQKDEKLNMVLENDVNSMGLWLYKKKYFDGQKGLVCNQITLSLISTIIQIYFMGQLSLKYFYRLLNDPLNFYEDEETAKEQFQELLCEGFGANALISTFFVIILISKSNYEKVI